MNSGWIPYLIGPAITILLVILGGAGVLFTKWYTARQAQKAGIGEAQERLTTLLTTENNTLRATLNSLQAQITEVRNKNDDLLKEVEALRREIRDLKQENFELRQEISEYRQQSGDHPE